MTPTEPNVATTGRYSINEAAQALGIHRNTLRKYLQAGAIKHGIRRATMRVFISGAEILRFWRASY